MNEKNILDIKHACHQHYDHEMPDRKRRDVRMSSAAIPTQFDIAHMEGELHYPVPREGKHVRQSSSVAGPSLMAPDDEDYTLQEQEEEEMPCVPIPMFVTGLCGHVAKDPTVSVIVLVAILASLCVEVMVLMFCAIWLRRRCHATCSKLIRRGTAGTVVTPHC